MRTETKILQIYTFEELSQKAQQNALEKLADINTSFEWWESAYEDAKNIGLIIQSFDLDRNRHAKGMFVAGAEESAHKITSYHGETTNTHFIALEYLSNRDSLIDTWPLDENGEQENTEELESILNELEDEFLIDILEIYSIILQNEYEYLCSDEAIIDTIQANEYEFLIDGTQF